MRIRMPSCIAIAGFLVLAAACQDAAGPAPPEVALSAKGGNGGGVSDDKKGDLYADLVFLLRDVDGLPLLKSFTDAENETVLCVQPVSYVEIPELDTQAGVTVEEMVNPVNGRDVWLIPLYGDYMPEPEPEPEAVVAAPPEGHGPPEGDEEVALAPCDPYGELNDEGELILTYGVYAAEVPFGRLNIGRAPERTVDRAYSEVDLKLSTATAILLDHAGRWSPDGVPIDAPVENLVIHRELLTRGQFGDYVVMGPAPWYDFLHHAASTLAGASDKFGILNEDLIVYNSRILGFPDAVQEGGLPTIEGDGVNGFPGEKYLDFGGFNYTRSDVFPGCIVAGTWDEEGNPIQVQGTIMDLVFGGEDAVDLANINAFATRADDARAVILYEHDFWIYVIDRIGETAVCQQYDIGSGEGAE